MAGITHLLPVFIVLIYQTQSTAAEKSKKPAVEFRFGNFMKIAEGQILQIPGALVRKFEAKSKDECLVACVNTNKCLSINLYSDQPNQLQCELLNWAGTAFHSHLKRKANSQSMQLATACSPNPCQNGGDCTADAEGHKYICNCTKGFSGINCEGCVIFDFENGLPGWTRTGTAFNNQPTYGDNSLVQKPAETANLKGNWYIGTNENRPSPSHPAGAIQGSRPTGTMTSPKFIIQMRSLTFLIGGGSDGSNERVELLIGGAVVAKAASLADTNTMKSQTLDVTKYLGQVAQLRIVDEGTEQWGHINVDHFHSCSKEVVEVKKEEAFVKESAPEISNAPEELKPQKLGKPQKIQKPQKPKKIKKATKSTKSLTNKKTQRGK